MIYKTLAETYPGLLKEWDYEKNNALELRPDEVAPHSDKKVWWICKEKHSYFTRIDHRTRMNSGCPYCAGKKVLQGENDLKTVFPEIAKEWDYANNELPPENYMPRSNKVVSWICPICNGSYKRKVIERTNKGFGCKYCMGEKHTSRQEQTLIYYFSKVVSVENRVKLFGKEVDVYIPELNAGIEYNGEYFHQDKLEKDAKKISHLQDNGVRVIVIQCGRERSIVNDTITLQTKEKANPSDDEFTWGIKTVFEMLDLAAPDINIKRDMIDIYGLYIKSIKENSITAKYPEIAKEWNYTLNKNLKPESFAYASNKKVWWTCPDCGNDYDMDISHRTTGKNNCPYCVGKRIKIGFNDLATTNTELVEEWHYSKNDKTPQEYSKGSDKKVWWKCRKCGYDWEATISSRVAGSDCPACAGRVVVEGYNDLKTLRPDVVAIWNYKRNHKSPSEYTVSSNQSVWWLCDVCNHEWRAMITSITRGRRCPECAKGSRPIARMQTLIEKNGSLADNYPDLKKEWDYKKNIIIPENCLAGSHKKVWWICPNCGNSYESSVYCRTSRKQGCPECGKLKSKISRNEQRLLNRGSLAEQCPEIIKEWDYEKNNNGPECYTKGSDKKVWWKCEKGHSWQAVISSRVNTGCGCPKCAGRLRCKNLDTGEEFDNYTAAAESVGVTRKAITYAIKHNSKCKGYRWAAIE